MAQNELWDMAKRRRSVDRGAVPEEERDLVRSTRWCKKKHVSVFGWVVMRKGGRRG